MKKLRKIKIKPILLGIFLVYVTVAFFDQQAALSKLNSRYEDLKKREAAAAEENKLLNEELRYAGSDSFVENEARQKLGLVKKGEIVYVDISKNKTGQNSNQKKW